MSAGENNINRNQGREIMTPREMIDSAISEKQDCYETAQNKEHCAELITEATCHWFEHRVLPVDIYDEAIKVADELGY
jgi:hypothetical protein